MLGKKSKSRRKLRVRHTLGRVGRRLHFEDLEPRLVLSAPEFEYASPHLASESENVTSHLSSISRDGKTVLLETNATTTSTGEPLAGADGSMALYLHTFTSPRDDNPPVATFQRINANLSSSFSIVGSGVDSVQGVTLTGSAVMSPNGNYVAFNVPYKLVGAIMTIDTRVAVLVGTNSNGDPIYDNPVTGEHYGTNPPLVLGFEQYIGGTGYIYDRRSGELVQLPGPTDDYGEPGSIADDGRAVFIHANLNLDLLPGSNLHCFNGGTAVLAVVDHSASDTIIRDFPVGSGARLSGDGNFAFYADSTGRFFRERVGGPSDSIIVSPQISVDATFSPSYDGRFVAFYTSARLNSLDVDDAIDVYSADLNYAADGTIASESYLPGSLTGFSDRAYLLASYSLDLGSTSLDVGATFESASVSDDGRFVAFINSPPLEAQGAAYLFSVDTGGYAQSFFAPMRDVNQLQISGDGRYLAFGIGSYAGGPFLEDVLRWRNPFSFVPNAPPVVVHPLDNVFLTEGEHWTYPLPEIFSDLDQPTSPTFHYSVTSTFATPSTLPAWLSYDESKNVLSGTPTDIGQDTTVTIAVTATDNGTDIDPDPLSTTTYLTINIQPVNHQPKAGLPLEPAFVMANSDFTYFVDAGTNFTDYDFIYGDRLTFTATLADGHPLPSWLNFQDIQTSLPQFDRLLIYGKPPLTGDTYGLSIRVTATDIDGLSATGDFNLIVTVPTTLPAPPIVYVDPTWAGSLYTPFDPDGDGPIATAYFGYNAFNSIQAAIDAVATNGNIIVHSGTYNPDSTVK